MGFFKNNIVAGVGIAFGAAVLAPIVLPIATRVGRPLAKSLVRGGMMLYEKGREAAAVAGESVEDMMAEIRAEGAASAVQAAGHGKAANGGAPAREDIPARQGGNGAGPIGAAGKAAPEADNT